MTTHGQCRIWTTSFRRLRKVVSVLVEDEINVTVLKDLVYRPRFISEYSTTQKRKQVHLRAQESPLSSREVATGVDQAVLTHPV